MNTETLQPFSIARWTKTTFLGWLLGVFLLLLLSSFLDSIGIDHMQFHLGLGMGAGVGLAQWWLLRKKVTSNLNWIWASALGMGIPFMLLDLLPEGAVPHKLALSIVLGALSVGILQYLLLKPHVPNAWFWVLGCFLGWTLGVATVFTIDYTMGMRAYIPSNLVLALINLLLILAGGIVLGVISGIALKRVLD